MTTPLYLAMDLARFGAKAVRLGEAIRAGFSVPFGWVLSPEQVEQVARGSLPLSVGTGLWAVRASAPGKGPGAPAELNVKSVEPAVRRVGKSGGAVIVQKMVHADCSGEMSTRDSIAGLSETRLAGLRRLARMIESYYRGPRNIVWAYCGNDLFVLDCLPANPTADSPRTHGPGPWEACPRTAR